MQSYAKAAGIKVNLPNKCELSDNGFQKKRYKSRNMIYFSLCAEMVLTC